MTQRGLLWTAVRLRGVRTADPARPQCGFDPTAVRSGHDRGTIASDGFRDFGVTDGVLAFDACQADGEWVEVGVDPATATPTPSP